MNIDSMTIRLIASPLKTPFTTHLGTVTEREAIIIEARDQEGRTGFGESDPFSSPWYTGETITTSWLALRDFLIPKVPGLEIQTPDHLEHLLSGVRGNPMAKSGLCQAVWDLHARQKGVYIGRLFGAVRDKVASGAVIATRDSGEAIDQIARFSEAGYRRYKIKISPGSDRELLSAIRDRYPDVALMADANAAYTLKDLNQLKALDAFYLQMIEQPLSADDLIDHAVLQEKIRTPICLDESIRSWEDARVALKLGSCKVLTLKMARVGGWSEAVKIHNLCLENRVPLWCGGMIEFGIAKAHNIALAALKGFTMPGDLSASSRYWARDLVTPDIVVQDGFIQVPDSPGIGFDIDRAYLDSLTKNQITFKC